MQKPRVFIGSSSEGHSIAESVFRSLERDTEPVMWTHGIFLPGRSAMETLERELQRYAFAVLVASADDEVVKRGTSSPAMRDNLLVEFGLFAGGLGRRRVFFLCPDMPALELPSDLAGIITATYDAERAQRSPSDRAAAVQTACSEIRAVIDEEWQTHQERERHRLSTVRATNEFQSALRLQKVSARLRDALLLVQREAIAAFTNRTAFEEVKAKATAEIGKIAESLASDATTLGVEQQADQLRTVASRALADLPFPEELMPPSGDFSGAALGAGRKALGGLLSGGGGVQELTQSTVGEVKDRLAALNDRYSEWWARHSSNVRDAAGDLQASVLAATVTSAMAQSEAHARFLDAGSSPS